MVSVFVAFSWEHLFACRNVRIEAGRLHPCPGLSVFRRADKVRQRESGKKLGWAAARFRALRSGYSTTMLADQKSVALRSCEWRTLACPRAALTPETSMFTIMDYALPADVAEHAADEVREYIRSAAQAWEKVKTLRAELAKERETSEAYRFALSIYGWTRGNSL